MAKKTTKKKAAKRAPAKKGAAAAPARTNAARAGAAPLDPVSAALQRRRLAMLSR
jgi:hypothetical protein